MSAFIWITPVSQTGTRKIQISSRTCRTGLAAHFSLLPTDVLKQILIPYITGSCDPVYVAEFAGRHKVRPPDTIDQMR